MLGYGLLSMFCYSGILDVLAVWMPRAAQFVAPLFLLLGPPLTLVHGTQHLTAYFVESSIICGLALASWALYRPAPIASIVLLMITCVTWIVCGIFAF
jgi:hypothetical protein